MNNLLCAVNWDDIKKGFDAFLQTMTNFFTSGLGKVILFIIVAIVGLILIKLFLRFLKKLGKKVKIDQTVYKFLVAVVKFVLYVLYVLTLLAIAGVPTTSLVAVITALTLGVTLAIQSSVSNLANGLILLANKPYKIGDFVEIGSVSGTVQDINMFNTKLKTPNNELVTIPHNITINNPITDFTDQEKRRIAIDVSVSYDSDIKLVKELLTKVLAENNFVLQGDENSANLAKMNSSSLDFSVKAWTATENYWDCFFSLTESIFNILQENNIEIPYNKLDVFIKNNEANLPQLENKKEN